MKVGEIDWLEEQMLKLTELKKKAERYEEALKYYAYDASSLMEDGTAARKALES
jgi:hypothetical protein